MIVYFLSIAEAKLFLLAEKKNVKNEIKCVVIAQIHQLRTNENLNEPIHKARTGTWVQRCYKLTNEVKAWKLKAN